MKGLIDFIRAIVFVWKHGQKELLRDHLTGFYNRLVADELMKKEIDKSKRYGYSLSLLLLDVDGLKEVNDKKGYLEGDKMLSRIAQTIKNNLRDSDVACRWGGDEFLILLTNTDKNGAKKFLKRVRKKIAPFKVSAGISEWKNERLERMILEIKKRPNK